jgi:hypothetical protein
MVTALVQLLVTVADRSQRSRAGSTVIPASPFQGLRSVRRIVTLINTNTVTIMPASGVSFQYSEELSDRVSLQSAIIVKCFGSLLYNSIFYSRCGQILIAKPCRTTNSQSANSPVGSTCRPQVCKVRVNVHGPR